MEKYQIGIATLIGIVGTTAIMMNLEKKQIETYVPSTIKQYETQGAIYGETQKVGEVLDVRNSLLDEYK